MGGPEHERLTWDAYDAAARQLAAAIRADRYVPDLVLGIARGGMYLATSLAYLLETKSLYLVNVEYYEDVEKRLEAPVILPPEPNLRDLSRKRLLLVAEAAECRIVTLFHKPQSIIRPHWAWRTTERWIDFPWSEPD